MNKEKLVLTDPKAEESITDILHDCVFDKSAICFNRDASILNIPFDYEAVEKRDFLKKKWFLKKYNIQIIRYLLKICYVENYKIYKGTQEGPGSDELFNKFKYDDSIKQIWISTVFDKGIEIKVKNLKVCIVDTQQIIRNKFIYSLF